MKRAIQIWLKLLQRNDHLYADPLNHAPLVIWCLINVVVLLTLVIFAGTHQW